VAQGAVALGGRTLSAGDALGFVDESAACRIVGSEGVSPADVLLFDLPA
jgi:hypothetical protein